jgi:hypothetical protein
MEERRYGKLRCEQRQYQNRWHAVRGNRHQARHSDWALGAFYRRLCARMVYFLLTRGEAYVDQGQQVYEQQQRQRGIAALKRRAAALGFMITPTPV